MSIDKSEFKASVLHGVGVKLDDMKEDGQRRQYGHAGAKLALKQVAASITGLANLAEQEFEAGKIPNDDLGTLQAVKTFIARAATMAASAAQQQENLELMATGRLDAISAAIAVVKKDHDLEVAKAEHLRQPAAEGNGRAVGSHPGLSLAARRKAEEAPPEPPKKKRTRRKKKDAKDT